MQTSESVSKLAKALVQAQADLRPVTKDSTNPHFKSKYASLDAVIEGTRHVLANYGLVVVQLVCGEGQTGLTTRLQHESGEFIQDTISLPVPEEKNQFIQTAGKNITYLRRFGLSSILNLATDEDNDGNGPAPRKTKQAPAPGQAKQPEVARPYDFPNLVERIGEITLVKANQIKDGKAPDESRARQVLGAHLNDIWVKTLKLEDKQARYEYFLGLTGFGSTTKMPYPIVLALLAWLGVDDFKDTPSSMALQEIKATQYDAMKAYQDLGEDEDLSQTNLDELMEQAPPVPEE